MQNSTSRFFSDIFSALLKKVCKWPETYIDQLNLPDLFDQLHGGVTVDEERLGVVAKLQRLQPLCHWRGIVAVVANGPHLLWRAWEKTSPSILSKKVLDIWQLKDSICFFWHTHKYCDTTGSSSTFYLKLHNNHLQ